VRDVYGPVFLTLIQAGYGHWETLVNQVLGIQKDGVATVFRCFTYTWLMETLSVCPVITSFAELVRVYL